MKVGIIINLDDDNEDDNDDDDDLVFYILLSTLFKSHRDNGRVIKKKIHVIKYLTVVS